MHTRDPQAQRTHAPILTHIQHLSIDGGNEVPKSPKSDHARTPGASPTVGNTDMHAARPEKGKSQVIDTPPEGEANGLGCDIGQHARMRPLSREKAESRNPHHATSQSVMRCVRGVTASAVSAGYISCSLRAGSCISLEKKKVFISDRLKLNQ